MKIREISYLVPPTNLIDDCLDVIVSLEDEHCTDGFSYVVDKEHLIDKRTDYLKSFLKNGQQIF